MKLENVLVAHDGYLKVSDFGLAAIMKGKATSFQFCGTPEYLAPEIIANRGYDKSVDWWATGVIIYELLLGFTPFVHKHKERL